MISLGCARNTVDSEKLLSQAKAQGAVICTPEKASTVLVNTCAFTQEAKQESIGVIHDLMEEKKRGRIKKIVVCGCLSERYPRELRENFKEVDDFFGTTGFKRDFDGRVRLTPRHSAYLKIAEGCANACSFCAIPLIKGPLQSRNKTSILKEALFLEDSGVRELVLIGQDITLYGCDAKLEGTKSEGAKLVPLLRDILKTTRIPWIRLLYLHPKRISDALIDLIKSEPRIVPYMDIPLQHSCDRILKLMNRGIGIREIVACIEKIRRELPGAALRTSFIVGFPSETEKEFRSLCDFVRSVRFDKCGAFLYSREEGTKAYHFRKQVLTPTKQRRYDMLMSLQRDISKDLLKKKCGGLTTCIIDEDVTKREGFYLGRTVWDAPEVDGLVFLKSAKKLKTGDFVSARITQSTEYDLIGEVVA
jgi:ribosomal protein S12 methylthiotransferase